MILYCVWLPFLYEFYLGKKSSFIDYSLTVVNTGAYLCNLLTLQFFIKNGYEGRKLIERLNYSFKQSADYDDANMETMNQYCKKVAYILTTLLNVGAFSMTLLPCVLEGRLVKYLSFFCLYCVWLGSINELVFGKACKPVNKSLVIVNIGAYLCSITTLHFYAKNGDKGRNLLKTLNGLFFHGSDNGDIDMDDMNIFCKRVTLAFAILLNTGCIGMALYPMLLDNRNLPTPGEFPGFNPINNTAHYVELYIVQGIGQILLSNVTASSDTFFICVVLMCSQQVKIMAKNFHNCLYKALLNHGVDKDRVLKFRETLEDQENSQNLKLDNQKLKNLMENDKMVDIIHSIEFKNCINELMISYVKHHQDILDFFDQMEKFFLPIVFIKVCVSMFYHVFITFACLSIKETSLVFILVEYEICAIAELLIFALAGQALINESDNLYTDLITSPWYVCDLNFQKYFYMVLIRSGRVSKISVGKLTNMSLPTFLLVSTHNVTDIHRHKS
ncbi:hypothetical protein FQR65_LT00073 [Abscondita terminalis]|nr:hypothetical protein FQR65_LT00073 [Abscondita terminalis]